jgi:hypothetical protein
MPQVMTTNAIVLCPHGGQGVTTPTAPLWSVKGAFVVREGDSGVLSCPFLTPCVGYTLRSMGLNSTKVGGIAAILVTDFNQSFTGLPLTVTETHTTIDNSTPAPIPAGGAAPPLSAELLDDTPPVVVAAPPVLAFNLTTQLPPTAPVTFTLTHPFPMQWILIRVSEPPLATNEDLTAGAAGATPAPAGGAWPSPNLNVVLTLTAVYMNALGAGVHHFYMTGVSKRGMSNWAESILTVS